MIYEKQGGILHDVYSKTLSGARKKRKTKSPLISIIIPARNAEKTIQKSIESVFDNVCQAIECIVVVNNSSDDTISICYQLQKKYLGLIVVATEFGGVSSARNEGLKYVSGKIIGFCDADDYYEKNAIDRVIRLFKHYSADIVVTHFSRVCSDGIIRHETIKKCKNHFISSKEAQRAVLNEPEFMGSVWNKFYRLNVISGIKFDPLLTHSEDTYFNMQVFQKQDLKIFWSDLVSYKYVYNPLSVTVSIDRLFSKNNRLKYLEAIDKIRSEYRNKRYLKSEIAYAVARLCIENYDNTLSQERKAILKMNILHNIIYILLNFHRHGFRRGIRLLIKGLHILIC